MNINYRFVKNLQENKEFFLLRYEYLKEHEGFKSFCAWADGKSFEDIVKVKGSGFLSGPIEYNFEAEGNNKAHIDNYFFYGNIHDPSFSFEAWHKDILKKNIEHIKKWDTGLSLCLPIENYGKIIEAEFDFCWNRVKNRKGTIKDKIFHLKQDLTAFKNSPFSGELFLKVDVKNFTQKEVLAEFEALLNHVYKKNDAFCDAGGIIYLTKRQARIKKLCFKTETKMWGYFREIISPPPLNVQLVDLKKYLAVYRIAKIKAEGKRKRNWKAALAEAKRDMKIGGGDMDCQLRTLRDYHDKAVRIIKNAGDFKFPGDYQTSLNKKKQKSEKKVKNQ